MIWGTGNVGQPALRTVLANPALELAAVVVSNPAKVGRDAGELCGGRATGLRATNDIDAALSCGADAVAYCASGDLRPDDALADIERCLRAGLNVVSPSIFPLYDPKSAPAELRERMEAACRAGNASLFCSGIDPGYIHDLLPLTLSAVCGEIEEIRAFEYFNYANYHAPEAVRTLVGFGMPMDYTPPMVAPGVPTLVWGGMIRLVARGLGAEIDEIREVVDRLPLERSVDTPIGRFEAGTQGALRFEVQGIVGGRPRLVVEHVTRISDECAPGWPRPTGNGAHGVRITGRPSIALTVEADLGDGDRVAGGNATAAARLVNAIPAVCEAPAGLLDMLDLPPVFVRGLLR